MARLIERRGNGYPLSRSLVPQLVPVAGCKPLGRATRKHTPHQVHKLAESLSRFGFVLPILIDPHGRVVAGWGLVLAARRLGLTEVPAVSLTDLSDADLRMLRLALNRLADDAAWDSEALSLEFSDLLELDPAVGLEASGFEVGEIDALLDDGLDQEDELPQVETGIMPVSRPGDLWILGDHRLVCGDALQPGSFVRLLGDDKAEMMFGDPPSNVPVEGHVSGLGAVKNDNFAMGSGELSSAEFQSLLKTSLGHAASRSINGAVHYVGIKWPDLPELLAAGEKIYSEFKSLCVWNKSDAGTGSLYREKHELICVFKVGNQAHINNVALGKWGRYRSNVWDYVGQTRKSKLALHRTVKPVAMIADAIRDCSNRGGLILDPFGGAGTTLIAAERTGRRARLIELEPILVDVTIERWQRLTGGTARHAESGQAIVRLDTIATTDEGEADA